VYAIDKVNEIGCNRNRTQNNRTTQKRRNGAAELCFASLLLYTVRFVAFRGTQVQDIHSLTAIEKMSFGSSYGGGRTRVVSGGFYNEKVLSVQKE
jgi:hypothetical protein